MAEYELTINLTEQDIANEKLVINVASKKQALEVVKSLKASKNTFTAKMTKDLEL